MQYMSFVRRFLVIVAVLSLVASGSARAADTQAQGVVRGLYAQLVGTMKQGDQLGFDGRYKKLEPVIRTAFNLPLMTRMAVGTNWTEASAKERDDLVTAFSNFSISTYASRFSAFDGETFTVLDEKDAGNDVIVETSLKPKTGDAIALNYLMRKDETGNYRIVDVFMNGMISELATRRAEFSSIARRDGIPALVNTLGDKAKKMGAS